MVKFATVFAILAFAATADDKHIGTIDYFGYSSLDLPKLQALLPLHLGDPLPSREARRSAEAAMAKAAGRNQARVNVLCCLPDGRYSLFVGFEEPGLGP